MKNYWEYCWLIWVDTRKHLSFAKYATCFELFTWHVLQMFWDINTDPMHQASSVCIIYTWKEHVWYLMSVGTRRSVLCPMSLTSNMALKDYISITIFNPFILCHPHNRNKPFCLWQGLKMPFWDKVYKELRSLSDYQVVEQVFCLGV